MSNKVLQIATDRILSALKTGTVPWRKPWKAGMRPCNIDGYEYRGINFFFLSMLGFEMPVFLTLRQIKEKGGRIKDGEEKKHSPVFFWKILSYTKDKQGNVLDDPRSIPLARYTQVWNIAQVDGIELPKRFKSTAPVIPAIDAAEAIVAGYKNAPAMQHGGNRACYSPVLDKVSMPNKEQFTSSEEYYSTLFHELAHSTGHLNRLNRKELMASTFFGSHDYSLEELVAEMGAAYLCAHAGIDNTLDNSAAYIAGWMKALQADEKMLMTAAARAQKAFAHIVPDSNVEATESEE